MTNYADEKKHYLEIQESVKTEKKRVRWPFLAAAAAALVASAGRVTNKGGTFYGIYRAIELL